VYLGNKIRAVDVDRLSGRGAGPGSADKLLVVKRTGLLVVITHTHTDTHTHTSTKAHTTHNHMHALHRHRPKDTENKKDTGNKGYHPQNQARTEAHTPKALNCVDAIL
jgi:hypothetical protein